MFFHGGKNSPTCPGHYEKREQSSRFATSILICCLLISSSLFILATHPAHGASPPTLDGTASQGCGHTTNSCTTTLTTTNSNDIIIVYTLEALDLQASCTFSVSDTAGLTWSYRGGAAGRADGWYGTTPRDQIGEFWAKSTGLLSSDTITESILGCASTQYGGEYNGLHVFGVAGANFNTPFDPNNAQAVTANANSNTPSVAISTTNSNDMIIGVAQQSSYGTLTTGSGFTTIISGGGSASEYETVTSPVTSFAVTFADSYAPGWYWEEMADTIQGSATSTTATFSGHAYVSGTQTPVYGATVNIGGTAKVTDSSGYYTITFPSGGTYNAIATAFGYCQSTASLPISSGTSQTVDFQLPIWARTTDVEPNGFDCNASSSSVPGWYNLRNDYGSVSANNRVVYWRSTSSNSLSVVSTSSGESGAPTSTPSGATNMIRMYGIDNSASGNGYAYTYFALTNVNIPLSSPMYLAFNIYPVSTPNSNGKVSVDAHFTDGTNLRDVQDSLGSYILDANQRRIHPSFEHFAPSGYATYQGNGWKRVVADLTELRYKTVDYLMVAYDNGQTGSGTPGSAFRVYFDDIRLAMPIYSSNTIDGSFENGLNGWAIAGPSGQAPRNDIGPCNGATADSVHCTSADGQSSVLIGPRKSSGSSPGDSYLVQVFRIPNNPQLPTPSLQFYAAVATYQTCGCTSNDWVTLTLRDRTTLQDVRVLNTIGTNVAGFVYDGVGFSSYSYNLASMKGHLVWLVINVHNDASGLNTWGWFDRIRIIFQGMTIGETSPSSATITLDPAVYRAGGGGTNFVLSGSFAGYAPYTFQSPCCGTAISTGNGGIQVGVDLKGFVQSTAQTPWDYLGLATSVNAWTSGGETIASNGDRFGPYFIRGATLAVTTSWISGVNDVATTFVKTYGYNLDPGIGQDPSFQGTTTVLGGLLIVGNAVLYTVPGAGEVFFVAGALLYAADLIYNSHTSVGTLGAASQAWSFPDPPCNGGSCPPPPHVSNPLAGGSAYTQAFVGGDNNQGGWYKIHVDAQATVSQDQCPTYLSPACTRPTIVIMETTYDLTVQTQPDLPPVASFSASSLTGYPNNHLTFDATGSYDPDGSITSYAWDFGDGTTGSGQVVSHSWTSVGGYTVTLTVTDNAGLTASTSQRVTIQRCC